MSGDATLEVMIQVREELAGLNRTRAGIAATKQSAEGLGALFRQGLGIGVGVVGAVAAVNLLRRSIVDFVRDGIRYNATIEQQAIAFETLLGSAGAAKDRIRELAAFAASTPFELPGVIQANRVLQTLTGGALATQQGMLLVGDAAAATGREFQEVAFWIGRLYSGLMSGTPIGEASMRLSEMGLITGDLAVRLSGLAENKIIGGEAWAIAEQALARYSGAMKKQADTFNGLFSTMKDTITDLAGQMSAPIFDKLKSGMREVIALAEQMKAAVGPSAADQERAENETLGERLGKSVAGINSIEEKTALLARFRRELQFARDEAIALEMAYMDATGPVPAVDLERRRGLSADVIPAYEKQISILEREGDQIAQNNAESEKTKAIRDEVAKLYQAAADRATKLTEEVTKERAAAEFALAADQEKLAIIQRQLAAINQRVAVETAAAAKATDDAQRRVILTDIELRAEKERIPPLKEQSEIEGKILADRNERVAAAQRELDALFKLAGYDEGMPSKQPKKREEYQRPSGGKEAVESWLTSMGTLAEQTADIIEGSLHAAIGSLGSDVWEAAKGTQAWSQAWVNLGDIAGRMLTQIITQMLVLQAINAVLGIFGFGVVSTGVAAITKVAAAGGGTFLTNGPTNFTVGDNPGGVEMVSVVPLSGVGRSTINGQSIAMAGGGNAIVGGGGRDGGGADPVVVNITQNFAGGVSREELMATVPHIVQASKGAVLDAIKRRRDGF